MACKRIIAFASALALFTALGGTAYAQDDDEMAEEELSKKTKSPDTSDDDTEDDAKDSEGKEEIDEGGIDQPTKGPGKTRDLLPYVEIGLGGLGNLGGNFLNKPGDQRVNGVDGVDPEYPGFAGFTKGGGFMFDVRFFEWFGIELDVFVQRDEGRAELTHTTNPGQPGEVKTKFDVLIGHKATHIPLLIKGSVPGDYVQPILEFGPEFVLPGDSDVAFPKGPAAGASYNAFNNGMYTMFTFGIGLEVKLPIPIPYVGFRIPFILRGSVNPGVKGERSDLEQTTVDAATGDVATAVYSTEWRFQAAATFGLAAYF